MNSNALDELLAATSRVPDATPGVLRSGRAALDAAIAAASVPQPAPARRYGLRLSGGWLGGKVLFGAGAVAVAAAAAVAVVALPGSATPAKTAPVADPATQVTAKAPAIAKPTATAAKPSPRPVVPTSAPAVKYNLGTEETDVTAAYVLDKAATASASQPNTWSNAPYWHTMQQVPCGGGVMTDNTWISTTTGDGVGEGTPSPGCSLANEAPFPIAGSPEQANFGQTSYTWAQLNALPTNPAKLWTILRADEQLPFTSDPALPKSGESDLFQSIMNTLSDSPTTPALRKALFEDAAKIPGVTVTGKYTDSLGRTGTALHVGLFTMVIDTANGQVLTSTVASAGPVQVCGASGCTMQPTYGSTSVYISAGPAYSAPKVPAVNGSSSGVSVAPTDSASAAPSPTSPASGGSGTGSAS